MDFNDQLPNDDYRPLPPPPQDPQHPMQPPTSSTRLPDTSVSLPQYPSGPTMSSPLPTPATTPPGANTWPKRNKRVIMYGAGMAILLIAAIVGAIVTSGSGNQNNDNTSGTTQTPTQTVPNDCPARFRRYSNKALDFRFCYPDAWGDAKVSDAKFDHTDNGTRDTITFFAKPQVHIGLVSDDWSSGITRSPTCVDPATQMLPDFDGYSAPWITSVNQPPAFSARRGIDISPQIYMIQETVDTTTNNGVCLTGYYMIAGHFFSQATATFFAPFTKDVPDPPTHFNDPTVLVSAQDRRDFATMVKSMNKL